MSDETEEALNGSAAEKGARTLDARHAHSARVYNYWLGGKDNYAADREAAEQAIAANPGIVTDVRANRAFLVRAVRFLASECGIRQFLDIGTGLPTAGNTHEVAQEAAPDARIVYVDNDPIVLAHASATRCLPPPSTCSLTPGASGAIQTFSQAGGIPSARMRSSVPAALISAPDGSRY